MSLLPAHRFPDRFAGEALGDVHFRGREQLSGPLRDPGLLHDRAQLPVWRILEADSAALPAPLAAAAVPTAATTAASITATPSTATASTPAAHASAAITTAAIAAATCAALRLLQPFRPHATHGPR